jgi:hypothetical protein
MIYAFISQLLVALIPVGSARLKSLRRMPIERVSRYIYRSKL